MIKAKPCPACGAPANSELCASTWTVRCALYCSGSPEVCAVHKSNALRHWNMRAELCELNTMLEVS